MSNKNLSDAKRAKYDEFYTLLEDVEKEMIHYTDHFYGRTVYCCCDNPEVSAFWKFFHTNFSSLGLKTLISTFYSTTKQPYKTVYYGGDDENIQAGVLSHLEGNGDFRSLACRKIFEECDIVVTNPPFSLFRDFISLLDEMHLLFLVVGNLNSAKYKSIFPLIAEGKIWFGVNNGHMTFKVPNDLKRNNVIEKQGESFAVFNNTAWYTNLSHAGNNTELLLTHKYNGNENLYPKYDTINSIHVDRVDKIPQDYYGVMGVPITYLYKHNPQQFHIVGEFNHGSDNEHDLAVPMINGKILYPRIAIQRII